MTASVELDHHGAYELLPWLANGTLKANERERVELHVRSCILCRRELKSLEQLRLAVRNQPMLHLSAESGLESLKRQIDREVAARVTPRVAGYASFLRFAAAACVAITLLGAVLWLAPGLSNRAGYSTLATPAVEQSAQIDLIFDQTTSAADIQALLRSIDGEIVAGPSELGRYGVRIHGGKATDAEVEALTHHLARDPRVRFAGRAFTESR